MSEVDFFNLGLVGKHSRQLIVCILHNPLVLSEQCKIDVIVTLALLLFTFIFLFLLIGNFSAPKQALGT